MSTLSEYFAAQAQWRWQKAEEYPDDARNAQSARALEDLAKYVEPDADGQYEAGAIVEILEEHMPHDFALGGEETTRAVSRYGYGHEVTTWHHMDFLEELGLSCQENAYNYAGEHDGLDPTGSLFDFEIEAAVEGVYLPRKYWEHRSHQMEHELAEAVESYRVVE